MTPLSENTSDLSSFASYDFMLISYALKALARRLIPVSLSLKTGLIASLKNEKMIGYKMNIHGSINCSKPNLIFAEI